MRLNSSCGDLPKPIYRRLLILTDSWAGERVSPGSLVIKCHNGGAGLPLFWGGSEKELNNLTPVLGGERSLYCFCGTWGTLPPSEENISSLAQYYLAEMLEIQPQGSYLLGGFCDGALIMYEIAKLLREQGYEVGILALFELDVTQKTLPLKVGRRLFPHINDLLVNQRDFFECPADTLRRVVNKLKSGLVALKNTFSTSESLTRALTPMVSKLKSELVTLKNIANTSESSEFMHYELTEYSGVVDLIYIKWSIMGFYQWRFFQRYWHNLALEGVRIEIISGCLHDRPNWIRVADIIHARLKQSGY